MEANQSQPKQGRRAGRTRRPTEKLHLRRAAALVFVAVCAFAIILASATASPPTAVTEAATAVKYEEATLKGTVNPEGTATTYWFEYGETTSYGSKAPASPESVGSGTSNVSVSNVVTGLKESTTYHFRVVAEGEGKTVPGEDASFITKGFELSFGEAGSGNGQFSEPYDVAVDSKGNAWVTDTANNRVQEFSSEGKYVSQFGKEGTGNGEFKSPKGIAVDQNGHIWVVDSGNARIQEFDAEGKYVSQFGKEGSGEGEFKSPRGIAVVGAGPQIYIADTGNNRVQKLSSSGKWQLTIGKEGSGDGELNSPTDVVYSEGGAWITDTGNNRVQKFNAISANFALKFGTKGNGAGEFESPAGIVLDFQERLWVVDSGNGRAQKFNKNGEYQDQIGESGTGSGQFINPIGVVVSAPQKVLVVDSGNDRVQSWNVKAESPEVIARSATEIKAESAVLNANINPEGLATTYWFEYGETTSYGTKVPITPESIGSGTEVVKVKQTATGLSKGGTYHFRAVAESSAGIVLGADKTFSVKPPKVTTESANGITSTEATLNGKVNPEASATVYWFEYGKTEKEGFEAKAPVAPESIGSGTSNVAVKQTVTGLIKNTEYRYRLVAENEVGLTSGETWMFKTKP